MSKGSALAEREAKAKYVGKGIGTKARTKSGSPIYFTFKGSDKPRYYSMDKLKEVLGPGGSDVLAGLSPEEKTVFARLNELAKKGSATRALRFEKLKTQFYKTGERARQAGKTTREQVWKPPDEKGEFKPRMKDGEPVTEIRTPEVKARKAAKSESRRLGDTASEAAARAQRSPERRKDRGELVQTVEGAIERGVESRIRKGLSGPLTPRDAATLKKLQEQELAKYGPEMLDELRRFGRIRTRPETPKTSREIADEMAQLRSERNPSRAIQKILRLDRIIRAHGGTPFDPMVSPLQHEVEEYYGPAGKTRIATRVGPRGPAGRVIKLPMPGSSRMGKATRKPIIKRPGKGPGMKEQIFSMRAKRFG